MKNIKDVRLIKEALKIEHLDGYFNIINVNKSDLKDIRLYLSNGNTNQYRSYSAFPKIKLIEIQILLLHAYVFSHDILEKAVNNSDAKDKLDELKNKVLVIRAQLRHLTNYIDSYDELLKEYKEV